MKRLVISGCTLAMLIGAAIVPGGASAQGAYDTNVGCGLGNMLFQEIGQDSILFQVFAVTTNGTLGNQTFGISSGTLECKQPSKVVTNEKTNRFVADNMDSLAQDMAAGQGETISTLAELMEVPVEKRADFYVSLQSNFSNIYASEHTQSAEVLDKITSTGF